jgi:hypothetical protein
MSRRKRLLLVVVLSFGICAAARAEDLPTRVGDCVSTTIKSIETRLTGTPGSGSAVSFENDGYQVGYDTVPAIQQSRKGGSRCGCASNPSRIIVRKATIAAASTTSPICARTKAGAVRIRRIRAAAREQATEASATKGPL